MGRDGLVKQWISPLEDRKIGTENCREHSSSTQEIGRNSCQSKRSKRIEIKSTVQVGTVPPRQRMQTQNRKNLVSHICYRVVPLPFFSLALSCSLTLGLTQALI